MRLLVIDPNKHLSEIVRSVMIGEGHQVQVATSGEEGFQSFREQPTELVLCLMELPGEDGVEILRRIRSAHAGEHADFILMSSYRKRYDRVVQDAMSELSIRDFIRHPFSVLDLVDMLRRLQPRAPAPPPPEPPREEVASSASIRRGRASVRNVSSLARLWSSRASGILQVDNAPGGVSGWVTLQDGGPAHANDWVLIEALLQGGQMQFDRAGIEGNGDRTGLGRLLFSAVHDEGQTEFGELHRYDAVVCTEPVRTIVTLPISETTGDLLQRSDGTQPIGEMLATTGGDLRAISAELHALRQLQMIVFQSPLARTSGSGASIKRARQDVLGKTPQPPSWLSEAEAGPAPPAVPDWMKDDSDDGLPLAPSWMDDLGAASAEPEPTPPPEAPAWLSDDDISLDASHQPGWLDDVTDWSSSVWTSDASPSSLVRESDSDSSLPPELPDWMRDEDDASSSSTFTESVPPSQLPSGDTYSSISKKERRAGHWRNQRSRRKLVKKKLRKKRLPGDYTRSDIQTRRRQDPDNLRRIFQQELERLRDARPAVVLGVPPDASPTVITQSARRLRHRYKTVADDRRMPEDVRKQAEELKGLVYGAYKRLKRGDDDLTSDSPLAARAENEEWLLEEGKRLIGQEKWARADMVLSKAHRIRIDHPVVLSHLGWARFHNPTQDETARGDEAVDLLILATQFDPKNIDTRYFLARVLAERDDQEAALRQVIQGLRISPDHEGMGALLKELNAQRSG